MATRRNLMEKNKLALVVVNFVTCYGFLYKGTQHLFTWKWHSFFYSMAKHLRNVWRCSEKSPERRLAASCPAWSHAPPHHCSADRGAETELTLSPLNSFCPVVVVPERRRGLEARRAGLRPDWRRLRRGRGQTTARRRWPLTFSVGWRPAGEVTKGEVKRGENKD